MDIEKEITIKDLDELVELCRSTGNQTDILAIGMAMGAKGLNELNKAMQGA